MFLDPPFGANLWDASAERLDSGGWLAANAWIYVESPADAVLALPATGCCTATDRPAPSAMRSIVARRPIQ